MKAYNSQIKVLSLTSMLCIFSLIFPASVMAQQFIVFNIYQVLPSKGNQLSDVINKEVVVKLEKVKGLESKRFFYNPSTGERGSVFVWQSEADWNSYLKSDLRKKLVNKVKPFIDGTVNSRGYLVLNAK